MTFINKKKLAPVMQELMQALVIEESLNLERIDLQLHEFNPFDVLGIQHREIRHSNFLAWMLDAGGSHGIGDYFLKGFLSKLEHLAPAAKINIFLSDLTNTRVYREWNNIDILIINDKLKFVIPIENKVWANKGANDQLVRYADIVISLYRNGDEDDYQICPVYLTPFNRMLSEAERDHCYQNLLYKQVISLLQKTIIDVEPANEIRIFINHYIDNVNKRIMNDDKTELNQLAHRIYRQHKNALEFIMSKKPKIYSEKNVDAVSQWLKANDRYAYLPSSDYIVRFLPKTVMDIFANRAFHSWGFEQIFCIELFFNEEELNVKFCAGGINNPGQQVALQKIKDTYFGEMKNFSSLKSIVKKSKPSSRYPAIAEKNILKTDDELFYSALSFREAFLEAFSIFEKQILDKWEQKVLEKKSQLFVNPN